MRRIFEQNVLLHPIQINKCFQHNMNRWNNNTRMPSRKRRYNATERNLSLHTAVAIFQTSVQRAPMRLRAHPRWRQKPSHHPPRTQNTKHKTQKARHPPSTSTNNSPSEAQNGTDFTSITPNSAARPLITILCRPIIRQLYSQPHTALNQLTTLLQWLHFSKSSARRRAVTGLESNSSATYGKMRTTRRFLTRRARVLES